MDAQMNYAKIVKLDDAYLVDNHVAICDVPLSKKSLYQSNQIEMHKQVIPASIQILASKRMISR